jgi:hypothetical protein
MDPWRCIQSTGHAKPEHPAKATTGVPDKRGGTAWTSLRENTITVAGAVMGVVPHSISDNISETVELQGEQQSTL